MARQPTPAHRLYEQGSAPQAQAIRPAQAQDVSSDLRGLAASLSRAGQAVENYQQTDLAIEGLEQRRREDDARVEVARRMADIRREAGDIRRTVFEEAPDGWRDATATFSQRFEDMRARHAGDQSLTPEASNLLSEQIYIFQQGALDNVADGEQQARGQWQSDTVRTAVDQNGATLVADPSQYEAMLEDANEAIGGISDANLRRDMTEYAQESYARYTVSGMISADPRGTLAALRDPDAAGAVGNLAPAARAEAINQAEAEIERRNARWRASVSQSVSAAERLMDLGLPVQNAPSVDAVRNALGPERALAYEATRAASSQFGRVAGMNTRELEALVSDTAPRTGERDAILHEAERTAAARTLEQRNEDPMQYQVRRGLTPQADLVDAFNQGDWGMVNGILQSRGAAATENGRSYGMRPLPLTAFEANTLGPRIRAMTDEQRGAFLRGASAWMGGDSLAYRGLVSQLFPDSPSSAYAGVLTGVAGERGARDAQLILRGEDILGGRSGDGDNGGSGRNRLVDMPEEDQLRRAWRSRVGEAYAGVGDSAGARAAEAQAYDVFRSAYAALSEQAGARSNAFNTAHADRAAQIATGGIANWGGRETLIPPGMSAQQFDSAVRTGFGRYQQFHGVDPTEYQIMVLGMTDRGVRYGVYEGDDPVLSPAGRPVEIEVRRR